MVGAMHTRYPSDTFVVTSRYQINVSNGHKHMKKLLLTQCALSMVLAGCGGGGGDTTPVASTGTSAGASVGASNSGATPTGGTTTSPLTATYTNFNYLANLDGTSGIATFTDKGVNNQGSLAFGTASPQTAVSMIPLVDGGISYGTPVVKSINLSNNKLATNLPIVSMVCQSVPGQSSTKSTDVLVAASATRLTNASQLATQTLTIGYEDCILGGTQSGYNQLTFSFDQLGNVTATEATQPNTPRRFDAQQVTNALNGQPIFDRTDGSYTEFFAYSYIMPTGAVGYIIVQKLAPAITGLSASGRGVVSFYAQEKI